MQDIYITLLNNHWHRHKGFFDTVEKLPIRLRLGLLDTSVSRMCSVITPKICPRTLKSQVLAKNTG